MTLMEVLIVASLISLISVAIYKSLDSGLKIWERNRHILVEEDILIFFEKLSRDIRNSFIYSKILYEGTETKFSCPVLVPVLTEDPGRGQQSEYVDQIGKVEYYFDLNYRNIYSRKADYGQALKGDYDTAQLLVKGVDHLKFKYLYLTQDGELSQADISDVIPSAIELEVKFTDRFGSRTLQRTISLPIGI